jgi:hypothetical protein
MKAIGIGRLAVVAGSVVVIAVYGALAVAQDSGLAPRPMANTPVDATGLGAMEAVTSEVLDQTNGSDPTNGSLPLPSSEARGADLSLKPLNTAPTSVLFRLLPTALSNAD